MTSTAEGASTAAAEAAAEAAAAAAVTTAAVATAAAATAAAATAEAVAAQELKRQRKRKADRDRQAALRRDEEWRKQKNEVERERQQELRASKKTLDVLEASLPIAPMQLVAHLQQQQRHQAEPLSLDDLVKDIYAYSVRADLHTVPVDDASADSACVEEGRQPRLCRVPPDHRFGPAEAVLRRWQESTSLERHGFCLCDLSGSVDHRKLVGQLKGYAPTKAAKWVKLVNGKQVAHGRSGFSEAGRIMCVAFRQEIETYTLQQIQYLLSIPDCPRQPQHTDFPTVKDSNISGADGLTILIALDTDAAWYIQPYGLNYEIRIQVPRFWAIAFKGDVPHAGAELVGTRVNDMRYHMYLTRGNAKVPHEKDGSIYNVRYL
ncbi:hypothetical protein JKP88DRAFT_285326 [Tribonema minus]|uniref:Uncharacterized protein n=1 Tax=Tribonema minus TaxID=303371 RepID=A0A836CM06_9STRA|nr:hypothetical protein JKP88DRAFT_285326 [Tribonema minus]